jgi:hypothetical protein
VKSCHLPVPRQNLRTCSLDFQAFFRKFANWEKLLLEFSNLSIENSNFIKDHNSSGWYPINLWKIIINPPWIFLKLGNISHKIVVNIEIWDSDSAHYFEIRSVCKTMWQKILYRLTVQKVQYSASKSDGIWAR